MQDAASNLTVAEVAEVVKRVAKDKFLSGLPDDVWRFVGMQETAFSQGLTITLKTTLPTLDEVRTLSGLLDEAPNGSWQPRRPAEPCWLCFAPGGQRLAGHHLCGAERQPLEGSPGLRHLNHPGPGHYTPGADLSINKCHLRNLYLLIYCGVYRFHVGL